MPKVSQKRSSPFTLLKIGEHNHSHPDVLRLKLDPILPTYEHRQIFDRYEITGQELKSILFIYGSSLRSFAEYIKKSRGAVSLMCRSSKTIKYCYAQMLETFIGVDMYLSIIAKVRKQKMDYNLALMERRNKQIGEQEKKSC